MESNILKSFWYRIESEKELSELKTKFNSDKILRNNEDIDLYSGEWVKVIVNDYTCYFVKPMDTLTKISKQFNIPEDKLIKDNNIKDTKLFIGQRLKIYKE